MNYKSFFILGCIILTACTSPKELEQHHYHYFNSDTLAIKAQVDACLTSWHEEMDSFFRERLEQYIHQQHESEQQHETITENITETIDSLGRKIRQEQRTISRDVTREQQILEQRLTREMEERISTVVDSLNNYWHQRFDSMSAHISKVDSLSNIQKPISADEDNRPWYKRLGSTIRNMLLGAAIVIVFILFCVIGRKFSKMTT